MGTYHHRDFDAPRKHPLEWLDAAAFAELAGISERAARKALERAYKMSLPWHGHRLTIRLVKARGAPGGCRYEVSADSLPESLSAKTLGASLPTQIGGIEQPCNTAQATILTSKYDWEIKYAVIKPILITVPGSRERSEAVERASAQSYLTPTGPQEFSKRTIYRFVKDYDKRGMAGLKTKKRADRGSSRVRISRAWDGAAAAAGISEPEQDRIQAAVLKKIDDLWAAGSPGWVKVQAFSTAELVCQSRTAGMPGSNAELLSICKVGRQIIESGKNYKLHHIKEKDAKKFSDKQTPRVRRNYDGIKPMDIIVADVHHMDNIHRRVDGSVYTPKAIAWYDIATNRSFWTIVFVEPGKMVRQEHVVASFIAMTQHPDWGMPRSMYLDNGGEFKKLGFVDDAMKLADLPAYSSLCIKDIGDDSSISHLYRATKKTFASNIHNSQPYNAQGKPGIEGSFSTWERTIAPMMPGWIGGNRMIKKTQNVGKEPNPFEGTEEDFMKAVGTLIKFWELQPQSGKLKNRSPFQVLKDFKEAGWAPISVDPIALSCVFANEVTCTVNRGEFRYDNTFWRCDELLGLLAGSKVQVRIPISGDRTQLPVLDEDGKFLGIAQPVPTYHVLDPEGAKDKARRTKNLGKHLSIMKNNVTPVDLVAEAARFNELHDSAVIAESSGTILLSVSMQEIASAKRELVKADTPDQIPPLPQFDPTKLRERMLAG